MFHIVVELNKYQHRNEAQIRHSKKWFASSHFSKQDGLQLRCNLLHQRALSGQPMPMKSPSLHTIEMLSKLICHTNSCIHKRTHFQLKCGVLVLLGVMNRWHKDAWNPPWWYILRTWSIFLFDFFSSSHSLSDQSSSQADFPELTEFPALLLITTFPLPNLVSTYSVLSASPTLPAHIFQADKCDRVSSIWKWLFLNAIASWT